MKLQKIHIFIILLLSLIFCSCLGGLFREGMSSQSTVTGSGGNSATITTGPRGNTAVTTSSSDGIQYNEIPAGQQDMYILKSQIVPPVCPACPQSSACPTQEKCPPCPACARCPEPAFDCKKVPNYNSFNPDFMPVPILSDFSTFGM